MMRAVRGLAEKCWSSRIWLIFFLINCVVGQGISRNGHLEEAHEYQIRDLSNEMEWRSGMLTITKISVAVRVEQNYLLVKGVRSSSTRLVASYLT